MEEEAPNIDPNLEGTATDAVHLTRYSNAAVIISINPFNKLRVIDNEVSIDNNVKRKLNCPSFFLVVFEACINPRKL